MRHQLLPPGRGFVFKETRSLFVAPKSDSQKTIKWLARKLAALLDVDKGTIAADTRLPEGVGLDSVDAMELIMEIEQKFEVNLYDGNLSQEDFLVLLKRYGTVGEMASLIDRLAAGECESPFNECYEIEAVTTDSEDKAGGKITKEIAKAFVKDDSTTYLGSYSSLDDDAAPVLAKHTGTLSLDSIAEISHPALKALSSHVGPVSLCGLKHLTKEQASILATFTSGVEISCGNCEAEVAAILASHPSFRIRDDGVLGEWLLATLGYGDEDNGRDWIDESVKGFLFSECDCWQSDDSEDGKLGSDILDVVTAIKGAGRREVHAVRMGDRDGTSFVFIGTLEDLKQRLAPVAEMEPKKKLSDAAYDEDDED